MCGYFQRRLRVINGVLVFGTKGFVRVKTCNLIAIGEDLFFVSLYPFSLFCLELVRW